MNSILISLLSLSLFLSCLILGDAAVLAQAENELGSPNTLTGRAGVAGPSNLDSLSLNPAHAGGAETSEAQVIWGYASTNYSQRYPGFPSHDSSTASLSPSFPIPKILYKMNRRFGIGGLIIPFPVNKDIEVSELPIVILNQENLVDIKGQGKLKSLVDLSLGYQWGSSLSMGLNLYYMAIEGNGDLLPSGSGGNPIASFDMSSSTLALNAGVKANLPLFSIGFSTGLMEQNQLDTQVDSILASEDESTSENGAGGNTTSMVFNPIKFGFAAKIGTRSSLLFDVKYKRASKGQTRFSVVDFTEKPLDVYDTVSIYTGGIFSVDPTMDILAGYFYEPSAVGPGSKGAGGKAGFGFMDLALSLGAPPSTPMWALGTGLRYQMDRIPTKRKRAASYKMAVEGGLVYAETSIGVDEDGEQPGAYLVKRIVLPLKFVYRF